MLLGPNLEGRPRERLFTPGGFEPSAELETVNRGFTNRSSPHSTLKAQLGRASSPAEGSLPLTSGHPPE